MLCRSFWINRLQDLLVVVRQTVFDTDSDVGHYELWMACQTQSCIGTLAYLSGTPVAFTVLRDLEGMFVYLAQEQGSVSDREARVVRRRVASLAEQ